MRTSYSAVAVTHHLDNVDQANKLLILGHGGVVWFGSRVEALGLHTVSTAAGDAEVPLLSNWPNQGVGRINPDGSWGSCTACHTRHRFSLEQARRPDACGKCHLGPDHPQMEVYKESKHGILYEAFRDKLNMDRTSWIVGKDYTTAPTCSTCHMSATPTQGATHDVGERISWTLRPAISTKLNMVV